MKHLIINIFQHQVIHVGKNLNKNIISCLNFSHSCKNKIWFLLMNVSVKYNFRCFGKISESDN
jgi:hypothetical protein